MYFSCFSHVSLCFSYVFPMSFYVFSCIFPYVFLSLEWELGVTGLSLLGMSALRDGFTRRLNGFHWWNGDGAFTGFDCYGESTTH